MSGRRVRQWFVVSSLVYVLGIIAATAGGYFSSDPESGSVELLLTAVGLLVLGILLSVVCWAGALVRAVRAQEWVWVALLVLGSGLALLVYVIALPDPWARAHRWPPSDDRRAAHDPSSVRA